MIGSLTAAPGLPAALPYSAVPGAATQPATLVASPSNPTILPAVTVQSGSVIRVAPEMVVTEAHPSYWGEFAVNAAERIMAEGTVTRLTSGPQPQVTRYLSGGTLLNSPPPMLRPDPIIATGP